MKNLVLNKIIIIESGKRQSQPCIRGQRISVKDILGWMTSGMTIEEILSDFPELNKRDIAACSKFAEDVISKHIYLKG
jgi:uncharacterized protein (DUF433 family)